MRRMLLPIIKKYWKLLLSAMLVSALGCGVMVGMSGAYLSLDRSLEGYVRSYRYPSAIITTEVVNRKRLNDILALDGVTAVNTRLCGDTVMIGGDRHLSIRAFSYRDDDLQRFHIWQSADCGDADAIMLEYNFALDNGIEPGDTVLVHIDDEYRSYAVSATVSAPETLSVQITEDSWGVNTDFGFVYFPVSLLEKEYERALEKHNEAEEKLNAEESAAEEQFNKIKQQLDDALKQLEEKDALFADAQKEAAQKKTELSAAASELRETHETLQKNLLDLDKAEKQLKEAKATLQEAIAALESGIAAADDAISKLQQAKAALEEIDAALTELNARLAELRSSANINAVDLLRTLPQDILLDDVFAADSNLTKLIILAEANGYPVDESMTIGELLPMLVIFVNTVEYDYAFLGNERNTALIERARNGEDISADPGYPALVATISRYDNTLQSGGDVVTAYDNAYERVSLLHERIHANDLPQMIALLERLNPNMTVRELRANVERLRRLVGELRAAGIEVNTIGDVTAAYDSSVSQLESSIAELESQRAEIVAELEKQGVHERDIDNKIAELRTQRSEAVQNLATARSRLHDVETQLAAVPDARQQLNSGIGQVDAGLVQIEEALVEIDGKLEKAKDELDSWHDEYNKKETEYKTSLADAMSEFAELRKELENAFALLDENETYSALCNQFLLYFNENEDQSRLLTAAEAALGDDIELKKSFIYADSSVKNRIDINLDPIDTMSTFMPLVFFIVILIVVFLFMSLVIRQCRREIGILRALGFTSGSIRLLYCGVDLVVSLLAIILGICIGIGVMRYVGSSFRDFFPLPEFTYLLDYKRIVLAAALTILVGQAATLIGTSVISSISPSEAMTRPAPVTARIPRLLAALLKRAKPLGKFSVSSMLRNKGRFVFSVVCVAASVMMIFSSLAFITSKNRILKELYTDRIHYDCQIFFKEQPDEDLQNEFSSLDYVSELTPLRYYEVELAFNEKTESAIVNTLEEGSEQVWIFDASGNRLASPGEGIILESHAAERLGARPGDTVTVNGVAFTVEAISKQSVSWTQYISEASAAKLGTESLGCCVLNIDAADEERLLSFLTSNENYLYSVFTRLSYAGNEKTFKTYDLASMIIIGFAVLIGLTIVYNTTQTNLLERKKELCVLRTLGFQRSELSRSWFSQSLLQFVFSLAIGLPSGIVIAKVALSKLSTEGREYIFSNGVWEYLLTTLIVFAYIVFSHLLAMRSVKRWDLVENVKEKE